MRAITTQSCHGSVQFIPGTFLTGVGGLNDISDKSPESWARFLGRCCSPLSSVAGFCPLQGWTRKNTLGRHHTLHLQGRHRIDTTTVLTRLFGPHGVRYDQPQTRYKRKVPSNHALPLEQSHRHRPTLSVGAAIGHTRTHSRTCKDDYMHTAELVACLRVWNSKSALNAYGVERPLWPFPRKTNATQK